MLSARLLLTSTQQMRSMIRYLHPDGVNDTGMGAGRQSLTAAPSRTILIT